MKKDKFIMIRVTSYQKELLQRCSGYLKMTLSEYILYKCGIVNCR